MDEPFQPKNFYRALEAIKFQKGGHIRWRLNSVGDLAVTAGSRENRTAAPSFELLGEHIARLIALRFHDIRQTAKICKDYNGFLSDIPQAR